MKRLSTRLKLIAVAAVYVSLFNIVYFEMLVPEWSYMGFTYTRTGVPYYFLATGLALWPSLWMPIKLGRPSEIIYWILYVVAFIPSMFIPVYIRVSAGTDIVMLLLALSLGFALIGAQYHLPLPKLHRPAITGGTYWAIVAAIATGCTIWTLLVFRGQMRLVAPENVYDELRWAADDTMQGTGVGYAMMILSGCINPLLMAWGMYSRRRLLFAAGAAGQMLMYVTAGQKSGVASVLALVALHQLLRHNSRRFGIWFCGLAAATLAFIVVGTTIASDLFDLSVVRLLSSIVIVRSLGTPGLLTGFYQDFFQHHPVTLLSHVHGMSALSSYPYAEPLGVEIGRNYFGPMMNANAHFWATDGIAGFGLAGIVIVSCLVAMIFWSLDSASVGVPNRLAGIAVAFAGINLANTSLFTALISGGLLGLIVLLWAAPRPAKYRSPDVSQTFGGDAIAVNTH